MRRIHAERNAAPMIYHLMFTDPADEQNERCAVRPKCAVAEPEMTIAASLRFGFRAGPEPATVKAIAGHIAHEALGICHRGFSG